MEYKFFEYTTATKSLQKTASQGLPIDLETIKKADLDCLVSTVVCTMIPNEMWELPEEHAVKQMLNNKLTEVESAFSAILDNFSESLYGR